MKIMLRKKAEGYEVYVPKKDLEEMVVKMEHPRLWGGWIEISNGWKFQLPDMPDDTRMPITIDARKLEGAEA